MRLSVLTRTHTVGKLKGNMKEDTNLGQVMLLGSPGTPLSLSLAGPLSRSRPSSLIYHDGTVTRAAAL